MSIDNYKNILGKMMLIRRGGAATPSVFTPRGKGKTFNTLLVAVKKTTTQPWRKKTSHY